MSEFSREPMPPPALVPYVGDQIADGFLLLVNGIQFLLSLANLAHPATPR